MKRVWVVALSLLLNLIVVSARPQESKASIEGAVTRMGSGEPIAGARVTIFPESQLSPSANTPTGAVSALVSGIPSTITPVLTDGQGKFSVTNLDPGSYRITFSRTGYVSQELGHGFAADKGVALQLAAGQVMRGITVGMTPTASISGRVRDFAGQPLPGIQIQLLKRSFNSFGVRATQVALVTRTNDRGEYRLFYVTPGRYVINAGSPSRDPGASFSEAAEAFTMEYYPTGSNPDQAHTLDIQPGAALDAIDLRLDHQRLYNIRGQLVDSVTGGAPAMATFSLLTRTETGAYQPFGDTVISTRFSRNAYNANAGTFEFRGIPPGWYGVSVRRPADGSSAFVIVQIENSDLDGLRLVLKQEVSISGRVRVEGRDLSSIEGLNRTSMALQTAPHGSPVVMTNVPPARTNVGPDGTFTLLNIRPVEYRWSMIQLPPGLYIKEAHLGRIDLLTSPVRDVLADTDAMDIVLGSDSGEVAGVVTDGNAVSADGIQVVLIPDRSDNRPDLYKSALTDRNGRFSLEGVAPGDYKLFAWDSIEPFSWFDPKVIEAFASKAKPVRVSASTKQSITLQAIPAR